MNTYQSTKKVELLISFYILIFIIIPIMSLTRLIFLTIIVLSLVQARFRPDLFQKYGARISEYQNVKATVNWFTQILDHYDYYTTNTWQQRYYVTDTYFDPKTGPIILYICGQWVCKGATAGANQLASQTKGLVIALQHRFYGQSMPFGDVSLQIENLKYLTTEQALKDIAYFITQISQNKLHNIGNNPWIVVGGSYPGAMVAWFRYKYPHLTIGSVSSSGVVNAIENFVNFDLNIYLASQRSGNYCSQSIKNLSDYVQAQLYGPNSDQFKKTFNAQKLSNEQFLWYWSDVIVFQIQYGTRTNLCNNLFNLTIEEQFARQQTQAILNVNPQQYSKYYISNSTYYNTEIPVIRAWNYQVCTQFGWLQTFSTSRTRSERLTIQFYRKWCQQTYGVIPNVDRSNTQFGGLKIDVSNLFMVNAFEDPWRWASLQKSQGGVTSIELTCNDCAHCVDLHATNKNDPAQLTEVRNARLIQVKRWIETYWRNQKYAKKQQHKKLHKKKIQKKNIRQI